MRGSRGSCSGHGTWPPWHKVVEEETTHGPRDAQGGKGGDNARSRRRSLSMGLELRRWFYLELIMEIACGVEVLVTTRVNDEWSHGRWLE